MLWYNLFLVDIKQKKERKEKRNVPVFKKTIMDIRAVENPSFHLVSHFVSSLLPLPQEQQLKWICNQSGLLETHRELPLDS